MSGYDRGVYGTELYDAVVPIGNSSATLERHVLIGDLYNAGRYGTARYGIDVLLTQLSATSATTPEVPSMVTWTVPAALASVAGTASVATVPRPAPTASMVAVPSASSMTATSSKVDW